MKLLYCGFNGFQQVEETENQERMISGHPTKKLDVCHPIPIYESEANTFFEIYLGWSKLIITTRSDNVVRGYWNGISGFNGTITKERPMKQVTCTEHLAVGIDCNGKLKKLAIVGTVETKWEDVLTVVEDKDNAKPVKFVKVASSDHSVAALDETGNIHLPPFHSFKVESMGSSFVDIACGKEHFIALTSDGTVYTWGSGSRGQLGHGSVESSEYPQEIDVLGGVNIVKVAAGGWHSCALSESGDVYIWGWNESGQLGLPCRNLSASANKSNEYVSIQSEPRLLDSAMPFSTGDVNVTSIACGARHTAVTLGDKSGWSWGWNGCGQLGTGDRRSYDTPVYVIQDVEKVMCGAWSTAWLSNL